MVKFSLEGESSRRRKPKRMRYVSDDDDVDNFEEDEAEDCIDEVANGEATANVSIAASRPAAEASSISFILTDPEVLDCSVCYESLTVPVFQCENGHIACSSCCTKLKNKCPFCSFPIGYNRCRAIEKVIESLKVLCQNAKYGCDVKLSLSGRQDHEINCIHSPVTCPMHRCHFFGSCQQLLLHCLAIHLNFVREFHYDRTCSLQLDKDCELYILKEVTDGALFILNNSSETNGNMLTVKYVSPIPSDRVLSYDLIARKDNSALRLECFMEKHSAAIGMETSSWFLQVPRVFLDSNRSLEVELCIKLLFAR